MGLALRGATAALCCMLTGIAAHSQRNQSFINVSNNPLIESDEGNIVELRPVIVSNHEQLGTNTGLPSDAVSTTTFSSDGLIWIGTDDGLATYDGYTVRTYMPKQSEEGSIAGKQVFDICELDDRHMCIALGDGGITVFDRQKGIFETTWKPFDDSETDFTSSFGVSIVGDYAYAVYLDCLVKHNLKTKESIRIALPNRRLYSGIKWHRVRMSTIPGNAHQMVLMMGRRTLCVLDNNLNVIREVKVTQGLINSICTIDESRVLVAMSNGLWAYNLQTDSFERLPILVGYVVHAICRNKDGDIWLAYNGNELMKWSPSRKEICRIANSIELLNRQTEVNDLMEDPNGLLWISTSNRGLLKVDTKPKKIKTYRVRSELPDNFLTEDFAAQDDTTVWAACGVCGIARIDIKNGVSQSYTVPHRNANSVYCGKDGKIFVGTTRGLMSFDQEKGTFAELTIKDEVTDTMERVIINSMSEDELGNLWVATQIGLYKYDGYNFERVKLGGDGIEDVNCVVEDADGRIWVGTHSGAFVRSPGEGSFRTVGPRWHRYNDNGVLCIAEVDRQILMGTDEGIIAYDKGTAKRMANPFDGEFNNCMIYSIAYDTNGVVWVSSSSGIGYVDTNYGSIYKFDSSDGLNYLGNETRKFSRYRNWLFFGQATLMNVINTDAITFNSKMPTTTVTEILYGQSGKEKPMVQEDDSTYVTKYMFNSSTKIKMASSDYTNPSRNEFMYRIDDGEWIDIVNSNEVFLSGLMPGSYRVQLRSTNSDKVWSYNLKTFYIRVDAPLWASRPALIFYSILLMLVVWFILNMRFRNINRKIKQVEQEARAKKVVEAQRNKLAIVNRAQTDSINYAKRLQVSLTPDAEAMEGYFSKLFVLYRPKDIVSGDFYYLYHRDDKTFVISADCTGHGVPGAFISILGIDHISNIIIQQRVDDAGEILTRLHKEIHDIIFRRGSDEFNDGMDITVCVVHHKEMKVNFAGAMNDLYLIRNNEILTYSGDRMSIGTNVSLGDAKDAKLPTYSSRTIDCQPGDMMYIFSDGYVDQFGGPEKKKFKVRRFKNLLLNIHKLPAKDQKILLNQKVEEWRGAVEQTDDISIIGFEPWAVEEVAI